MKSPLVIDNVIQENDLRFNKLYGIFPTKKTGQYLTTEKFLKKAVNFENKKGTDIVTISYKCKDKNEAYNVVNSIITNYIKLHKELNSEKSKSDKKLPNLDRYFDLASPLAFMPSRATKGSAGYDFRSPVNVVIHPNETIVINTGVRVFMNPDEVLLIYPRSSVAINKDLILKNSVSVIDSDFHDEIQIPITNVGKLTQYINREDKIAQGVFQKFLTMKDMPIHTRSGGIGSTGV